MLSIERCRSILGLKYRILPDAEILRLRDQLYEIGRPAIPAAERLQLSCLNTAENSPTKKSI
jgi:hypothetical protein